jgi:hypothetical protein
MMQVRSKYDGLVTNAVISGEELELAQRSARRKNLDVETVLTGEFQVKLQATRAMLSAATSACPTSRSSRTASSRRT